MGFDFEGLYGFHGHRCPMSTMGARLGLAAMSALGVTKADQFRIKGVYRSTNCALDGIQFVTGCTLGNGNLEYSGEGMASFLLSWRDGSGSVTVTVSEEALARFRRHKELKTGLENEGPEADPDSLKVMEEELKTEFDALVDWVQTASEDRLVVITHG